MTTAVTAVEAALENLRRLRLCQALLRSSYLTSLQPQLLIPTARTLLAGSMASEEAVIFTVLIFRQDVPKLLFTMKMILCMKDT